MTDEQVSPNEARCLDLVERLNIYIVAQVAVQNLYLKSCYAKGMVEAEPLHRDALIAAKAETFLVSLRNALAHVPRSPEATIAGGVSQIEDGLIHEGSLSSEDRAALLFVRRLLKSF